MIRKHILRNRNLAMWLGAGTLMGTSCSGTGDVLNGVGVLLQIIGSFV